MSRMGSKSATGRRMQRPGGQQRLISEGAAQGRASADMDWSSGDNLVTGTVPEEDDVDHRVEPQSWLPEGAAENQDQAGEQPGQGMQQPGKAGLPAADGGNPSPPASDAAPGGARMPPYPAQMPAAQVAAGPVTSAFGIMTSPGKAKKSSKIPKAPDAPKAAKVAKAQAARQAQNGALPARRAQLAVIRLEPWSVMKFSFMISLVGWVVLFVAVAALYYVLSRLGVFASIEKSVTNVTSSKGSAGVKASHWFSASRVLGYTMLIGAVNVVLITALATVGSVIYNLVTHVAGGIEVTLKETD
jgi:hypothetical protein